MNLSSRRPLLLKVTIAGCAAIAALCATGAGLAATTQPEARRASWQGGVAFGRGTERIAAGQLRK